jgi:two-component system response regulator AtoC
MQNENKTNIIGNSETVRWLRYFIAKVAPLKSNILITGSTGVGKTLAAQEIHSQSGKEPGAFLKIFARNFSEKVIEHEVIQFLSNSVKREASAKAKKSGLIEISTLLIEDISELSKESQARLLTFLEECHKQRFGAKNSSFSVTRVISTTREDITFMLDDIKFRKDLYFRLSGSVIHVPLLKERLEDLPFLTQHILDQISTKLGIHKLQISVEALNFLQSYDWPGNIRELENILETAAVIRETHTLGSDEIKNAFHALHAISYPKPNQFLAEDNTDPISYSLNDQIKNLEKELIIKSLLEAKGVQTIAASFLGLTPKNLWKKMQKHGIRSKKLLSFEEYQLRLRAATLHSVDSKKVLFTSNKKSNS